MKSAWIAIVLITVSLCSGGAAAEERATKQEAETVVKKAAAFIKENGTEKGYAEVNNKVGPFTNKDLYVVVYDMEGKCLAHGFNPKLIGKDLIRLTDVDGKAYVKERVELGKTKGSFWHDYKFTNPVTKQVESKETYCEKLNETLVCAGIYKQ